MNRKDLKKTLPLPNEDMILLGRISALYGALENIVNSSTSTRGTLRATTYKLPLSTALAF